jgi:hypothetical protein
MSKEERITRFVSELADLCEKYEVEISTQSGCDWSPALAEDTGYYTEIPSFASPGEIRSATISSSEC